MYQQNKGGSGIDAGIGIGEAQVMPRQRPVQQQRIQSPYGRGMGGRQTPPKLPSKANIKTFIGHSKYFENKAQEIRDFKNTNLDAIYSGDQKKLSELGDLVDKYDFDANNSMQVAKEYENLYSKYAGKNFDRLEPESQKYLAEVADPEKNQGFHLLEEQKVQEKFFPHEFYQETLSKNVTPTVLQTIGEIKEGMIPTQKTKETTLQQSAQGVSIGLKQDPKYFKYLDDQIKTLPKEEVQRLEEIGRKYQPYSATPALIGLGAEEFSGMKGREDISNVKQLSKDRGAMGIGSGIVKKNDYVFTKRPVSEKVMFVTPFGNPFEMKANVTQYHIGKEGTSTLGKQIKLPLSDGKTTINVEPTDLYHDDATNQWTLATETKEEYKDESGKKHKVGEKMVFDVDKYKNQIQGELGDITMEELLADIVKGTSVQGGNTKSNQKSEPKKGKRGTFNPATGKIEYK